MPRGLGDLQPAHIEPSALAMTALIRKPRRSTRRGPGQYDRSKSSDERRAEQREMLIAAAMEVFAAKGFARASVDAIVKRARMSRRTFYEHFDDLTDAMLAVYDFAASALFEVVSQAVASEPNPVAQVRSGVAAFLSAYAAHAPLARVLHREILATGPKHLARYNATRARFAELFSDSVQAAYDSGIASRPPDEPTIHALIAGIESVAMQYVETNRADRIDEAVPPLAELVTRAFR